MSELKHTKMLMQYDEDEGGGGGMEMELLWENASPTSDFREQTLNINFQNYKEIRVDVFYKSDIGNHAFAVNPTLLLNYVANRYGTCSFYFTTNVITRRYFEINGDKTSITFYSATYSYFENITNGVGTTGNMYLIPFRIYGVK